MTDSEILDWIEDNLLGRGKTYNGDRWIEYFGKNNTVVAMTGKSIRDCVIKANEDK